MADDISRHDENRQLTTQGVTVADEIRNLLLNDDGSLAGGDSGERDLLHAVATVNTSGDTTVVTPTSGKKLVVHWVYAITDPASSSYPLIKFVLGTREIYRAFAIAKRQQVTGATDETLKVNLSASGPQVAVTVIYEEIT